MKPFNQIKSSLLKLSNKGTIRLVIMILTLVLFILAAGAPGAGGGLGD